MEMIPVSLFMIPGDCWCSEDGEYAAGVWQEVYDVENSGILKMGECDDWCCVCRNCILDFVWMVSVFMQGGI